MLFNNPQDALRFILAGKATVTLQSTITGDHYTYKVSQKKDGLHFVNLMIGPDNERSFAYMGVIFERSNLKWTPKSCVQINSLPFSGFRFVFERISKEIMPKNVKIWHDGRCGSCRRKLTVPESIECGLGPYCRTNNS